MYFNKHIDKQILIHVNRNTFEMESKIVFCYFPYFVMFFIFQQSFLP